MTTKKRKRDADNDAVSFRLSTLPGSQAGPMLASFPALKPPESTSFECFLLKRQGEIHDSGTDFTAQPTFIAGETEAVEFFTSSEETLKAAAGGCRYLIGVHNKKTRTTVLRPAPLHMLTRRVKALKCDAQEEVSALQWQEARAALGATFGTKKAKASIRARERNKVDVAAMESVVGHLQDRIEMNTESLPTKDAAQEEADSHRLIPPCHTDAQTPEEVYSLHDIIPEAEWNSIPIQTLLNAKDEGELRALLPHRRSNWVNQHFIAELSTDSPDQRNLHILYYISVMFAFRWASSHATIDREKLETKLTGVPGSIIEGLLSRFTETQRGSTTQQTTTQTQTTILTYMFALCLHVNNYASDPVVLAADLNLPQTRVHQLFKSLGCKIMKLPESELKRLGLPGSAGETKRAVLRVPVVFPKARKRKTG